MGLHLGELLGPRDKMLGSSLPQCLRMLATAALLKVGVIFRFDIDCNYQSMVCLDTYHICQAYPSLLTLSGLPLLLLLHSTLLLAAAFFVLKFLPETKNRSLTEIHQHFSKTKEDQTTLSSEKHNLPGMGSHTADGLPTQVSETVKETMIEMVSRVTRDKKKGDEVDCDISVESGKEGEGGREGESGREGVRRRSTMVIPSIQPKLPNCI